MALLLLCLTVVNAQEERIVVTHWDLFVTQEPALSAAIAQFESEHPNISIERSVQSELEELLPLAFESGNAGDVVWLPQNTSFNNLAKSGWLLDISQFEDLEDLQDRYPQPELTIAEGGNMIDGVLYSMPFEAPLPWLQMYVNTGMYREAGIVNDDGSVDLPETWDDVIENSRIIKENLGQYGYGFGGADTWAFGWQWWMCQLNGTAYSFRGFGWNHQTGEFDSAERPCYTDLIEGLLTMRDEELIPPNAMSLTDEQARAMFATNEIAHIQGGTWIIPGWAQTHPDFTDYSAVPLPIVNTDGPRTGFYANRGGRMWGMNANLVDDPAKMEAAWEWFKFLHSPDFARLWTESGSGLSLLTPGDPAQYGTTPAMSAFLSMGNLVVAQPPIDVRNPDTVQIQPTLIGPNEVDILIGLYTGELTDIQAALADLDQRNAEALLLAIEDANAAGYSVELEDFVVPDWDATESYTGTLE